MRRGIDVSRGRGDESLPRLPPAAAAAERGAPPAGARDATSTVDAARAAAVRRAGQRRRASPSSRCPASRSCPSIARPRSAAGWPTSACPRSCCSASPSRRTPRGSGATAADGIVPRALEAIRRAAPGLLLMTDVCLCEYTDHGHCGVLRGDEVDNDATLAVLAAEAAGARPRRRRPGGAVRHDGRARRRHPPRARRGRLRAPADHVVRREVRLGALRAVPRRGRVDAAVRRPARATRWIPPTRDEALREVALDIEEGADIVMVKPALPYLDVVRRVKERFG